MRGGLWDQVATLQNTWAETLQAEFELWVNSVPKQQFAASSVSLPINDFKPVNGRGGWLFNIDVTQAIDSLTIATTESSGDFSLRVTADSIDGSLLCESKTDNTNVETCQLSSVAAGTYFATIDVGFAGSDVVDGFITACTGANCKVDTPATPELRTFEAPVLPVQAELPEANTFGSCQLLTSYSREDSYVNLSITNTTQTTVKLYWVDMNSGKANLSKAYATLALGENYQADYWRKGDRLMLADSGNNCLGVAVFTAQDNQYEVKAENVVNAIAESSIHNIEVQSCDLLKPYQRTSDNASVTVTNNADKTVNLYWVNNSSGEASLSNNYAALATGQSYVADYWVAGDRMMLANSENACLGVVEFKSGANIVNIEQSLFQ
jgi:hypothetical protein